MINTQGRTKVLALTHTHIIHCSWDDQKRDSVRQLFLTKSSNPPVVPTKPRSYDRLVGKSKHEAWFAFERGVTSEELLNVTPDDTVETFVQG